MNKIFCIGANKTGTTSLTNALQTLGFSVCPESIMFYPDSKYFYDQKMGKFDSLFELVHNFDSFEDRPWNHGDFYKELDKKFPNSKFILTIRDTENWIESYRRWNQKINLRDMWFYQLVSQVCYGVDDFLLNEELMRDKYNERNNEIINYFEDTNQLLIINFEENQGWKSLCEFLDKPVPKYSFPHLNRTK